MDETRNSDDARRQVNSKQPVLYGPDNKPIVPNVAEKSTGLPKDKKQQRIAPRRERLSAEAQARSSKPLWRRIPSSLWAVIVVATLVITLLEGVPWLSVEENELLDQNNPYSALFFVENDGYAPISDLDAICEANLTTEAPQFITNNVFQFDHFADYIAHSGRATIPCFHAIGRTGRVFIGTNSRVMRGDLKITISYSFYPVSWHRLRRHQSFRFKAVADKNGSLHWTFAS